MHKDAAAQGPAHTWCEFPSPPLSHASPASRRAGRPQQPHLPWMSSSCSGPGLPLCSVPPAPGEGRGGDNFRSDCADGLSGPDCQSAQRRCDSEPAPPCNHPDLRQSADAARSRAHAPLGRHGAQECSRSAREPCWAGEPQSGLSGHPGPPCGPQIALEARRTGCLMGSGAGEPPRPHELRDSVAARPERLGGGPARPEDRLSPITPARAALGVKSQGLSLHVKR